jgi:hypothetical protein
MKSENKVTDVDVYKAIGHLDEATEVMQHNHDIGDKSEEEVIGIFSFIGRIIKALIAK